MPIDSDDANRIRVGTLGRSVDDPLDAASLPTTFTSTGPFGGRNALDSAITQRTINLLLNDMNTSLDGTKGATNLFASRFTDVVGDETTPEFATLGGTLIEAVASIIAGGGGPGGGDVGRFQHEQTTPAAEWHIQHELGQHFVLAQVVSAAGDTLVGKVEFVDDDNVTIRFAHPVAGTAIIRS